jgi:hypothetical protein
MPPALGPSIRQRRPTTGYQRVSLGVSCICRVLHSRPTTCKTGWPVERVQPSPFRRTGLLQLNAVCSQPGAAAWAAVPVQTVSGATCQLHALACVRPAAEKTKRADSTHTLLWKTVGIQQMHAHSSAGLCSISASTRIILSSPHSRVLCIQWAPADTPCLEPGAISPV